MTRISNNYWRTFIEDPNADLPDTRSTGLAPLPDGWRLNVVDRSPSDPSAWDPAVGYWYWQLYYHDEPVAGLGTPNGWGCYTDDEARIEARRKLADYIDRGGKECPTTTQPANSAHDGSSPTRTSRSVGLASRRHKRRGN